jgi:hypothetical protein
MSGWPFEPGRRNMVCGLRSPMGCTSGRGALERSTFELMIVDVFVPYMRGFEAVRSFHQRAPSMPLVAIFSDTRFPTSRRRAPIMKNAKHDRDERSPRTSSFRREHAEYSRR